MINKQLVGEFFKDTRKDHKITLHDMERTTGLHRNTVYTFEKTGVSTLDSFYRMIEVIWDDPVSFWEDFEYWRENQ